MSAAAIRQPLVSYLTLIVLGFIPVALVTRFQDVLPNRLVIQWDTFGNLTVIGTRAETLLMAADVAVIVALAAVAIMVWQHRVMLTLGLLRAFIALNLAQIVVINLLCAMVVSEALGFGLTLKPMIPPAMAVALFAAGVLCLRIDRGTPRAWMRAVGFALVAGGPLLLAFSAVAANAVVGYYASAVAILAMIAVALPQNAR